MKEPAPSGTISLPKPTPEQEAYLRNIQEQTEFDQYWPKRCVCTVGGARGAPAKKNDPPCPVHGTTPHGEVRFDPNVPPEHIHNRTAAARRGLRFDTHKNAYVDAEDALVRDRYGQPY